MKKLEQFYNEAFRDSEMPDFANLTDKHIKALQTSLDFALWKITKAKEKLLNVFLLQLKKVSISPSKSS